MALLFGILISGIAMPVIWFIIRLLGLIDPLLNLFGGGTWLMYTGGIIFGMLVGALSIIVILKAFGEWNRLGIILGAVGGVIGGFPFDGQGSGPRTRLIDLELHIGVGNRRPLGNTQPVKAHPHRLVTAASFDQL